MLKIVRLVIVLLLLAPAVSHGKWTDRQGNPVDDTEWMKSKGDFGAQLLLVADEDEFLKRWETPSDVVAFDTVSQISRGESLITPIVFNGCQPDEAGNCFVSGDFKILRPDGQTYADMPQIEIWQSKPPPPDGILELGVGYLKVIIEPEDPDGMYTVQAKVTDHIQKTSLVLTQTFSVTESKTVKPVTPPDEESLKQLSQWLTYYYERQHSDQDIENITAMFQDGFFGRPNVVAPLIMFLAEFFRQNESRIPAWQKPLHDIAPQGDAYLFRALWQAHTPNTLALLENWPDKAADKTIEEIKETPPIDLATVTIDSPAMLDMLWATFMASGNPFYVERIIGVLALPTDASDKDASLNNMILVGAAQWSLASNAVQHERVLETCRKFADSDNATIKKVVSDILEDASVRKTHKTIIRETNPDGSR